MLRWIEDKSDRFPVIFGFALFGLLSIVPGLAMLLASLAGIDLTYAIIAYAFALQFVLCLSVERTVHLMLPFIVCIISFVIMDVLYFAAMLLGGSVPQQVIALMLALGMNGGTVFVTEVLGIVASLIFYALFVFVRALFRR